MESAKYIGTFIALPQATDFGLSLAQPNTLWQAWQRADGTFWLNGLDNAGLQTNANYTIPGELLHTAFTAMAQPTTARPKLSANSSTLLQHWYKRRTQASGTKLHQLATPSLTDGDMPHASAKATQGNAPQEHAMAVHSHIGYESDESGFADPGYITPEQEHIAAQPHMQPQEQAYMQGQPHAQLAMHNSNFTPAQPAQQIGTTHITGYMPIPSGAQSFAADEGNTIPTPGAFPQSPVLAVSVDMTAHLTPSGQGVQFTAPPSPPFATPTTAPIAPVPTPIASVAGQAPGSVASPTPAAKSPLDNLNEGRRKVIEQAMRQEFALLLEHMQNEQNAMTLRDMEELIRRQIPNTWQLKYMFSEFGLALRKEQQHQLALLCHQRALECSPNDANVLFNLARTEVELGAMAAARMHLTQALEVAPDFTAAKNFLAFLSSR